jgi:hypothetical protein
VKILNQQNLTSIILIAWSEHYNIKGLSNAKATDKYGKSCDVLRLSVPEAVALNVEYANKIDLALILLFQPKNGVASRHLNDYMGDPTQDGSIYINQYRLVFLKKETGDVYYDNFLN